MSNIHEVARQAGVSAATVSRTFSAPNLLNEHTQKRVLEVARRLNYQPRSLRVAGTRGASRAKSASINAIGFQFFAAAPSDTLQTNTFYAPMLAGALAEASDLGLHLLLHTTDRHSLALESPRMIVEQTVDGMLLVGTADPAILATFAQHVPHIVLLDNHDETGAYESVISDGFGGAFRATQYLLELGHRRICFLSEPGVATFQDRLRGYRCALLEAGLELDANLVVMGSCAEDIAERVTQRLRLADAPTALLSANDYSAFSAMRACREMGLQVPRDLSVIGFDDIPFSAHTDVPLTTVRVDKEFMGAFGRLPPANAPEGRGGSEPRAAARRQYGSRFPHHSGVLSSFVKREFLIRGGDNTVSRYPANERRHFPIPTPYFGTNSNTLVRTLTL